MKRIVIGALALASSTAVWAASGTSTATVNILNQAITLTNTQGLNFGTVLPYGRQGTVRVATNGAASASGAYISDASAVSASGWKVTGVPGAYYGIVLPANNTVTVSDGSGDTMSVTSFASSAAANEAALDASGAGAFTVGATLVVGANQPAGTYTGTFDVTVAYN